MLLWDVPFLVVFCLRDEQERNGTVGPESLPARDTSSDLERWRAIEKMDEGKSN